MTDVPIDNIVPFNDGQVRWADGFVNLLAGLGVQGRDKFASQQFTHSPLPLNELENAYRSDWIARKVVTIPAWDMTREWRSWQADPDQIELLEAVEQKLFIQMKLQQALIKSRLYGGAAIIIGVDAGKPEEELDLEEVGQDALKFIHVVSKQQLRAGPIIRDISSKYFGQPEFYEAANEPAPKSFQQELEEGGKQSKEFAKNQVKLHPSRVVKLIGMDTADQMLMDIWGDSVLQSVNDAVKMCGLVTGSLATLVAELKVDVIKIPELKAILSTKAGENKMLQRFSAANAAKSVINTIMIDGNEEWQRIQASLTGVPETLMTYMQIAAGAADIPATRFLGMSPTGLNATGEADIRNYYDRLAAEQETVLTPTMTILDEVLIRSALGDRPPEVWYEWKSLWQHSDAEKAELALKKAQAYQIDVNCAQLPVTALANARANQLIEDGTYPGLEAALEDAALEGDTIEEHNAPAPVPPALEEQAAMAENGEVMPPGTPGGPPMPPGGPMAGKLAKKVKPMLAVVGGDSRPIGDRDQPRVPAGQPGGGQWGSHGNGGGADNDIESVRPSDSDPSKPWPKEDDGNAKAGDEILAFRLQSANGDLAGANGGDVNAVANHLTNIDDFEKPAFVGGSGDTIAAYQVKLDKDPGKYDAIAGGKSAYGKPTQNPDSVGRSTKRGANGYVENAYSFPKSGEGYQHKKLDSVPLSAVRGKLKEMGYHSADDAGTLKTSEAIRSVFNENTRTRRRDSAVGDEQERVPAGSSAGGQFGKGGGGSSQPRMSKEKFAGLLAKSRSEAETRAAAVAKIEAAGKPVRMQSERRPDQTALVGPDVSEPGKFRITRFDPMGPIGHTVHNTLGQAAEEAMREGYKVTKRDSARVQALIRALGLSDYNMTHVPAGSSEGGQFGTSGSGSKGKGGKGKGKGSSGKSAKGSKPEKSPAEKQEAKKKRKEKLEGDIKKLESQKNQGSPEQRAEKQAKIDKLKQQLERQEGGGKEKGGKEKGGGGGKGGGGKGGKKGGEKGGEKGGGKGGEKGGGGEEKGGKAQPPPKQESHFKSQETGGGKGEEGKKFTSTLGNPLLGGGKGEANKQSEAKAKEIEAKAKEKGGGPIDPKLKEEEEERKRKRGSVGHGGGAVGSLSNKRDSVSFSEWNDARKRSRRHAERATASLFSFDVSRETEDANQCHNPAGPGGGQFCSEGGAGGGSEGGEPHETKEVPGYETGEKGAGEGKDLKDLKDGWYDANPHRTVEDALKGAQDAQGRLGEVGPRIAEETGTKFKDPGIKADLERIQEKADERGGANRVSDLFRGGFEVDTPAQADAIAKALAKEYGTANENWKPTPAGYTDKAVSIRDKNGMVGEVQIADKNMWEAKNEGGGHNMYKEAQKLESGIKSGKLTGRNADLARDRIGSLNQGMKDVYAEAKSRSGREWDKIYGR